MKILVTGGLGYIGSHTVVELDKAGYEVVIVDNLSNSSEDVLDKLKEITGKDFPFYRGDVRRKTVLRQIFSEHEINTVIHFAGAKAVGESVLDPIKYYENNVLATINLITIMNEFDCHNFVFSSSATVYGEIKELPLKETSPLGAVNPYGRTKLMIEDILRDLYKSNSNWNIVILRYFNPLGAHSSHLIGEKPNGIPNNLVPYVAKVASGKLPRLNVFGNDYNTPDGTGVRDYIHVVDLAKGHVLALKKIESKDGLKTYNLGTGVGYSVLDVIKTFEEVNGVSVPYEIMPRRPGDVDSCYADPTKAYNELGFKAELNLSDMLRDSYLFEKNIK